MLDGHFIYFPINIQPALVNDDGNSILRVICYYITSNRLCLMLLEQDVTLLLISNQLRLMLLETKCQL